MVSRQQLPYLAVISLGLVLLALAVLVLTGGEFTHEVEPVAQSEYRSVDRGDTDDEFATSYANMSAAAQDAFREALVADDGTATVRTGERVSEFRYGDSAERYYVSYEGEYYLLTASGASQLGDLPDLLAWLGAAGGVIAVVVPCVDLWRHRRRQGTDGPDG